MNPEQPDRFEPPPEAPVPSGEPAASETSAAPAEAAPAREPFWTYFDLAVFAGMALPCMLVSYAVVKLLLWLLHVQSQNQILELLPAQTLFYLMLFGVLFAIFRMYGRPFWRSIGWTAPRLPLPLIIGAGMATAIAVTILANLIQTPDTENPMSRLLKGRLSLALMAAFGVTLGPLCEELAFRGFLQPLLVRSFGVAAGILGAAIPFGLLHYQQYGKSWRHALLISFAGAAFGWVRHEARSTMASTIMHSTYNALFFITFLLAQALGK